MNTIQEYRTERALRVLADPEFLEELFEARVHDWGVLPAPVTSQDLREMGAVVAGLNRGRVRAALLRRLAPVLTVLASLLGFRLPRTFLWHAGPAVINPADRAQTLRELPELLAQLVDAGVVLSWDARALLAELSGGSRRRAAARLGSSPFRMRLGALGATRALATYLTREDLADLLDEHRTGSADGDEHRGDHGDEDADHPDARDQEPEG